MNVLLLDCETTGLDTNTARIIELGAMVVDEKYNLVGGNQMNTLVYDKSYGQLDPVITQVTGIKQEDLESEGASPETAMLMLHNLVANVGGVHFVMAYNRGFDEPIVKNEIRRQSINSSMPVGLAHIMAVPWLCGMADLEKNYEFKSWRLMHVALEYGVTVNPKELHRAIADVELMRKMLQASGYSPTDIYAFQQEPWVYVRALTRAPWEDKGESTGKAKQAGFSWEMARGDETQRKFAKCWVKRIKQRHVAAETARQDFKVVSIY